MADQGEEREAVIDRLYALPLGEFTSARDELARQLRRGGDRDAGVHVKRLLKPSVPAWALNQMRRNNPGRSDALLEAGQRLREGQESLLAGGGAEPLQRAAVDERQLVDELARHAEHELVAAGRPVSALVQEKLRATLHAVANDPEAREGLAAGRLVRDHEASGLGPLVAPLASSAGAAKPRKEPVAKAAAAPPAPAADVVKQRKESVNKAAAALERRVRRLEERLERARARQRERDEESADTGRRLGEAQREAERAAAELERAEVADERARGRAEEAAETVLELERERGELT